MARFTPVILTCLALAACGQGATDPAPDAPPAAPLSADVAASAPVGSPALSIEQSCRKAAQILYGQSGDAVVFSASDFTVSWPAPVDGGRLTFACSVVGAQVSLSDGRQSRTVDISSPAETPAQTEVR